MSKTKVTLYQMPISHYCEKVRWALAYKKVPHKTVDLMPGFHVKKALKLAGKSSLPIIEHNKQVVHNSSTIITYLDSEFSEQQLTPTEPGAKAEALQWEKWLDSELGVDVRRFCYHYLLANKEEALGLLGQGGSWLQLRMASFAYNDVEKKMRKFMKIDEEQTQASKKRIIAACERLHAQYDKGKFLVGSQFSRADLTAAALLAPLYQPQQYGIHWPQTRPDEINELNDTIGENIAPIVAIYQGYR